MNLQYSLFAKLIGKYLVGSVGRSKKCICHEIFSWKNNFMRRDLHFSLDEFLNYGSFS